MSHLSHEDYTADTDPAVIFSGNKSCVLNPQATEGPFCKFQTYAPSWSRS